SSTDARGTFAIEKVPAGRYHIEASSPRFGTGVGVVDVTPGGAAEITLRLGLEIHREEIIVSARPMRCAATMRSSRWMS
ncbi:MAG: carboxypeptidase regulatory-like domain-containing protein, partial [Acidobacteria bacterium]|nr:carboxypeptidase regulatory-like domain-containing protein [Acidobacteriota bacterium]